MSGDAFAVQVRVGQVWADNDKRAQGRQVRVVEIRAPYVLVELVGQRGRPASFLRPDAPQRAKPGRQTRIRLDRFRPTSSGYRLVEDVVEQVGPPPLAASRDPLQRLALIAVFEEGTGQKSAAIARLRHLAHHEGIPFDAAVFAAAVDVADSAVANDPLRTAIWFTDDQLDALRALLNLVHYDDTARRWRDLLPARVFTAQRRRAAASPEEDTDAATG